MFGNAAPKQWIFEKLLHAVEPVIDFIDILQRRFYPTAEHSRAHGRLSFVENPQKRAVTLTFPHTLYEFEISERGIVKPHDIGVLFRFYAVDIYKRALLRFFKVCDKRARSRNKNYVVFVDAERLERDDAELLF